MPLKPTSRTTAPVHRTPNDYTADWSRAPQWAKNMQERLKAANYSPYTTYGGSAAWNRHNDDYEKVRSWETTSRNKQWTNDYVIQRR